MRAITILGAAIVWTTATACGEDDTTPIGPPQPVTCPAPQHDCAGVCVDSSSPDSCGDRCDPCPAMDNGTAICTNGACDFQCADGYFECLGACLPDSEAPCEVNLPANGWQLLTSGDTGPRTQAAMIYRQESAEYLLIGGSMGISEVPRPYDIQSLSLADLRWKNHYPLDHQTDWGPEVGDCTAPSFPDEHFGLADAEGNARPNWATYPGIPSYYQYAYDPVRGRLVMYLWNRTFSYDAAERVWTLHAPAADPAGGAEQPRLLWGAMAFDSVDNEVLLVGGGNVLDDDGAPGTWIYEVDTDLWRRVADMEPGPRAVAPLAVDPDRRQALLFGGDELDRLKSDTWVFDFATESWTELAPTLSPAPRGGHTLVFLPTSRTTVLIGGFEYDSSTDYVASHYRNKPWEIWRFDWSEPSWTLVKRFDESEPQPDIWRARNITYAAAVGAGDVVVMHSRNGYEVADSETWALRVDPTVTDAAGTSSYGVSPGTEERRTGAYDPEWYATGWPAPDPTGFAATLDAIAPNRWTEVEVPNRPAHNHDWGTAAISRSRGVIYRYSGGHSAHSGTDVLEYDLGSNRFALSYAPEIPLDFEYTNDQTPGQWSFDNNPFMTGHTYKTYVFSDALDRMVLYKRPRSYFYDPTLHDFELDPVESDMGGSMYTDVLCEVSDGVVAWTPDGLFELDPTTDSWAALPTSGTPLPSLSPDRNTMVYDPGADRLLLCASTDTALGEIYAYSLATGAVTALGPTGAAAIATAGPSFVREAVFVGSEELLVLGTSIDTGDGRPRTPVYHASENRWYAYDFDAGGLQGEFYDVSLGLVIDASERLWAMNTNSRLFLLKIDPATATRIALD